MLMSVFNKIMLSLCKARAKGCQFTSLWIIFGVKVDLRRKSIFFIGGHVVDSYGHKVCASTMKLVS